jgi:hypothetical protein
MVDSIVLAVDVIAIIGLAAVFYLAWRNGDSWTSDGDSWARVTVAYCCLA